MVCAQSTPTALQWWIVGILSALLSALKQRSTHNTCSHCIQRTDLPLREPVTSGKPRLHPTASFVLGTETGQGPCPHAPLAPSFFFIVLVQDDRKNSDIKTTSLIFHGITGLLFNTH